MRGAILATSFLGLPPGRSPATCSSRPAPGMEPVPRGARRAVCRRDARAPCLHHRRRPHAEAVGDPLQIEPVAATPKRTTRLIFQSDDLDPTT
jgi:hypothetical protein